MLASLKRVEMMRPNKYLVIVIIITNFIILIIVIIIIGIIVVIIIIQARSNSGCWPHSKGQR